MTHLLFNFSCQKLREFLIFQWPICWCRIWPSDCFTYLPIQWANFDKTCCITGKLVSSGFASILNQFRNSTELRNSGNPDISTELRKTRELQIFWLFFMWNFLREIWILQGFGNSWPLKLEFPTNRLSNWEVRIRVKQKVRISSWSFSSWSFLRSIMSIWSW